MFNNTYFIAGGGGGGGSSGGGTGPILTSQDVSNIIQNTVTRNYVDTLAVPSGSLKDTRTFPTNLPPAKYARIYDDNTGAYQDKVYQTVLAQNSALFSGKMPSDFVQRSEFAMLASSVTCFNSNQLRGIPGDQYALKTDLVGLGGGGTTGGGGGGLTNTEVIQVINTTVTKPYVDALNINASTLAGNGMDFFYAYFAERGAFEHVASISAKIFTNQPGSFKDTVFNSYCLGSLAYTLYALKTDLEPYALKVKASDSSTYTTVGNSLQLGGKDASLYALKTDIPTIPVVDLTPYTKKYVVGDATTQDTVYNATQLASRPASDYALKTDIPTSGGGTNNTNNVDLSPYAKKYVAGDTTTQDTVYQCTLAQDTLRFDGLLSASFAKSLDLQQVNNNLVSSYAKKYVPGDTTTLHTVYQCSLAQNSLQLNGKTSDQFLEKQEYNLFVASVAYQFVDGLPPTYNTVYNATRLNGVTADQFALKTDVSGSGNDPNIIRSVATTNTLPFYSSTHNNKNIYYVRVAATIPNNYLMLTSYWPLVQMGSPSNLRIQFYNGAESNNTVEIIAPSNGLFSTTKRYTKASTDPSFPNRQYVRVSPGGTLIFMTNTDLATATGGGTSEVWLVSGDLAYNDNNVQVGFTSADAGSNPGNVFVDNALVNGGAGQAWYTVPTAYPTRIWYKFASPTVLTSLSIVNYFDQISGYTNNQYGAQNIKVYWTLDAPGNTGGQGVVSSTSLVYEGNLQQTSSSVQYQSIPLTKTYLVGQYIVVDVWSNLSNNNVFLGIRKILINR